MTDSLSSSPTAKSFARIAVCAAVLWGAAGALACRIFSPGTLSLRGEEGWFLGLWALSLFNLLALGMTVREIMGLVAGASNDPGNQLRSALRAFSWGTLKLVCFGIFIVILLRDRDVSAMGRILGAGTLVVVPLLGGLGAVKYA